MIKKEARHVMRKGRHKRISEKIKGTAIIPRLNVFKSNKHIRAQIIDDTKGFTLTSSSSLDKGLKIKNGGNIGAGQTVGQDIAKKALKMKIKKVIFDRGGHLYHGRVKALAEAARENGLEF